MGESEFQYYAHVNTGSYWERQNECYIEDGYPEDQLISMTSINNKKYPGPEHLLNPDQLLKDGEEFYPLLNISRAVKDKFLQCCRGKGTIGRWLLAY